MVRTNRLRLHTSIFVGVAFLIISGICKSDQQQQTEPASTVSVNVVVKEADSGAAISQARLTLTFKSGKLHHTFSYGAKTNAQGEYRFTDIPKGTIHLFVTAERHQSYGKEIELEEDNQVVEVKLKKPQPQL